MKHTHQRGFSLIELLLVLALIAIVSAIAIPSFLGQRRRARLIGDAQANAAVLAMQLETRRADTGVYGPANQTYTWVNGTPSNSTFLPNFSVKGASKMNFRLQINGSTGLTYLLTVTDPSMGSAAVMTRDQAGEVKVLVK